MKILLFPLTRVFIGFLIGILLCQIFWFSAFYAFCSLLVCFSGLLINSFLVTRIRFPRSTFGILVILTSISVGITTVAIHKENRRANHYINQIVDYEQLHNIDLLLVEKLKSSSKNQRYLCAVENIDHRTSFGKIILNISKKDSLNAIKIGTHLGVTGYVVGNKNPLNPNLFDYGKYLENQEIYAQVYGKYLFVNKYEPKFWAAFSNFRDSIISNLERSKISKEELNVLNALILGQQQEISSDILKDYQYAGAVHVLSVSGLHVGFIMLFISFLLKPLGNSRKSSLLKLIVIVLSLWSFAILTGLSASIVRSATMFSFVAVGVHLRRTVNIYHTLLVSMLLILLFKPSFLFDVGFQLSYLALFFIIWLQPLLTSIWQPKNKIIKYFWDIITVSFAAQIGAMPLSIYYFHQFPGLFFVTNLLILPLLAIIMAVGVVGVVIASFGTVPYFMAKVIEWLIRCLNTVIHWVASMDSFVFRNISFSKEMLLSSYLAILLIVLWIQRPKFERLIFCFLSVIILQGVFIFQKNQTSNTSEFIVFNIKKNTLISKRFGDKITVYGNDSILKTLNYNTILQSYLTANFCKITKKIPLQNFILFKNNKVLVIDSSNVYPSKISPDMVIIIQSPKLNIDRFLKTIKPQVVIVDGSNFKSYVGLWKVSCRKRKIPFHYTNEKGFYKN